MNIIRRIRDYFGFGPTLRNKPGGMAYIKGIGNDTGGASALNGQIVRTVRISDRGAWQIDPQLRFVATRDVFFIRSCLQVWRGDTPTVIALNDEYLEPLKEVGDDERDESLEYLPPVPRTEPVKELV